MILLPLFNLIENELASSQSVEIHQVEQVVKLVLIAFFIGVLLFWDHLRKVNQIGFVSEELLKLLEVEAGSNWVNKLAFEQRDEDFAEASWVFGSGLKQFVAEGLRFIHHILGVLPKQRN